MSDRATLDALRMQQALALAEQAMGRSDPNPRVGCIIGTEDGRVLGSGSTQEAGGPHAEVMALRAAHEAGHALRGATAWVTLEPCAHFGRTPPCSQALVQAGLARVVVGAVDPFPQVAGAGIAGLRQAGVQVDMAGEEVAQAVRELNIGFFSRIERGRPWVRVKVAASLDGRTALPNGISQWITGPQARADGHAWRRRAGAVLTGVGTVLADDPRLDVREVPTLRQPLRVLLDSSLRTPAAARILQPPGQVLVATAPGMTPPVSGRPDIQWLALPPGPGGLDLEALLQALGREHHVNELHVEAGARLTGSWLRSGLADELLLYLAPRLLGPGRPLAEWPALQALDSTVDLRFHEVTPVGDALRVRARFR